MFHLVIKVFLLEPRSHGWETHWVHRGAQVPHILVALHCLILDVNMHDEGIPGELPRPMRLGANWDLMDVVVLLIVKEILNCLLALWSMIVEPHQVLVLREQQLITLEDLPYDDILEPNLVLDKLLHFLFCCLEKLLWWFHLHQGVI